MVDALAGVDADIAFDVTTAGAAKPTLGHEPSDSFKTARPYREENSQWDRSQRKKISQQPQTPPPVPEPFSPPVSLVRALMTVDFAHAPLV